MLFAFMSFGSLCMCLGIAIGMLATAFVIEHRNGRQ